MRGAGSTDRRCHVGLAGRTSRGSRRLDGRKRVSCSTLGRSATPLPRFRELEALDASPACVPDRGISEQDQLSGLRKPSGVSTTMATISAIVIPWIVGPVAATIARLAGSGTSSNQFLLAAELGIQMCSRFDRASHLRCPVEVEVHSHVAGAGYRAGASRVKEVSAASEPSTNIERKPVRG